jgi:3-methyl-2-oxobutanoate hydroxymethyltransferase
MAKPTIKDLQNLKGKRKIVLTTAFDYYTARACELAGIDALVTWPQQNETMEELLMVLEQVRKGAPNTLIGAGIPRYEAFVSETDAVRCAWAAIKAGADMIYSSGMSLDFFKALAKQRIPCVGHVGFIPAHATWFGGPRAVGKTSDEAWQVYEDSMVFQDAGAVAIEMECVPAKVAEEITKRLDVLVFSMGSGPACDGQYLFSCDLLGLNDGRYPRHSKKYANFFDDSVEVFKKYKEDVTNGGYPAKGHQIEIKEDEFSAFVKSINKDAQE